MTFTQSIRTCYGKYATFSGRARRSEYWWFLLFYVLVAVAIALIEGGGTVETGGGGFRYQYQAGPLATVWTLVNLLPLLAVAVRRLHDIDKSGWWILLGLIPLIGTIILLVWYARPGTPGPNRFGEDPLG